MKPEGQNLDVCCAEALLSEERRQDRRLWSCMGEAVSEIRRGEISSDEFRGVAANVVS